MRDRTARSLAEGDISLDADARQLESLGYRGALRRRLGLGDAFVMQFAMICVLGSIISNFTWGISTSGSAYVGAWLLGGALQMSVALAIAELSAAYPLAGACYSWLRRLSSDSIAWLTGYLLLTGYIAAVADDNSGLASSLLSFTGTTNATQVELVGVALACLAAQTTLSILSIWVAARSLAGAVILQLLTIACIVVTLTILGLRHSPSFLFNAVGTTEHEHLPPFLLMLIIPAWTMTGFDTPGNLAEELTDPTKTAPRGLMSATIAAFVCGTALIVVPLLAMTDLTKTAAAPSSFLFILQTRLGAGPTTVFEAVVVGALFLQPVVLQVVAGRLLWAQARDGAWPAAGWLVRLNRQGAPARATILCAVVAAVLCLGWPALYALGTVWPALWDSVLSSGVESHRGW